MSFLFGGGSSKSKTNENVQQEPWAPAIPYLLKALDSGQGLYDTFGKLSPEEQAATQQQLGVLRSRLAGDSYDQIQSAGQRLLNDRGPKLKDVTPDKVVAPTVKAGTAASRDVSAPTVTSKYVMTDPKVDATAMRSAQGVLNPTQSLSKLLSGQVDNPQMDAMAAAATRDGQRAYQDAVEDSAKSLTRSVLPAVRSGAMLAGGYGGSRQGIAEGVAMGDRETALARGARDLGIASTDASANLRGKAYESAQDRMASTADNLDARAQELAEGNVGRQLQKAFFNTTNELNTNTGNADRKVAVDTGNATRGQAADTADADRALAADTTSANLSQGAQTTNAGNQMTARTTNNSQALQEYGMRPSVLTAGADLMGKGTDFQDADYQNMLSVLNLPRNIAYDAYGNWINPLTGVAGTGGQKQGTSTTKSSNLSIAIGSK